MNSVIETAVSWAVGIANDSAHGYDQGNRDGPDYDCSSLLCHAYEKAGLNTRPGYTPSTHTMKEVFTAAGFADVTASVNLATGAGIERGDILLNIQNHTAMSIGSAQVVQASSNEFGGINGGQTGDQTGGEINISRYYNYPWDCVLRYGSGGSNIYIVKFTPF